MQKEFDRYIIESKLGQGAMSMVYCALDTKLNRRVALKILHPHLLEEGNWVERFEVEAKTLAKISHPNVTQVYDFGSRDNQFFIALELIEGMDFGGLVKKYEAVPWEIAFVLFFQAGNGLQYVHQHGIIHRDIKLANLLLQADGSVKLSDFSISKSDQAQSLTADDHVAGTPCYISPELINGERPSVASDIFAFGVSLYYVLTGKPPFFGKTIAAIFETIRQGRYPSIASLGIVVPEDVSAMVHRCMAAETRERYAGMSDVVKDLNACLSSGSIRNEKELVEHYLASPSDVIRELRKEQISAYLLKARELRNQSKVFESLNAYKYVLGLDPGNDEAQEQLGTFQAAEGSTEIPIRLPEKPAEKSPLEKRTVAIMVCIVLAALSVIFIIYKTLPEQKPAILRPTVSAIPVEPVKESPSPVSAVPASDPAVNPSPVLPPSAPIPAQASRAVKKILPADSAVTTAAPVAASTPTIETPVAPAPAPAATAAPCSGKITLYSAVWAYVFIDGEKKGVAPAKTPFEMPCGNHRVELRRPNGSSYSAEVKVDAEAPVQVSVQEKDYQ